MFDLILCGKLSEEAVSRAREDTLTVTALAPIAYGPPRVRSRFLSEVAGVGAHRAFELQFWPWLPLAEGNGAEPDALGQGPAGALLVEAKAGTPFTRTQLEREGTAARRAIGRRPIALLTISDRERPPSVVAGLLKTQGGPYHSVAHASWARLYLFLESVLSETDEPGYRRLVTDALAVLDHFKRRPYRGILMTRLNRISPGLEALEHLAGEVAILHRLLSAALEPKGLVLIGSEDTVVMDGAGRAFDRPVTWLPTHITLAYGAEERMPAADFYFVRIWLRPMTVWLGLSIEAGRLRRARGKRVLVSDVASHAAGASLDVAGVDWVPQTRNRVTVRVEPLPASAEEVKRVLGTPSSRLELVRVHPASILSRQTGAARVEREVLRVVKASREIPGLGAP